MALLDELISHREEILTLAKECGLKDIRVFGSVARGEEDEHSDIDMLVNYMPETHRGMAVFSFPTKLEAILGRKIDMVFEKGIYHRLRDTILNEARPI